MITDVKGWREGCLFFFSNTVLQLSSFGSLIQHTAPGIHLNLNLKHQRERKSIEKDPYNQHSNGPFHPKMLLHSFYIIFHNALGLGLSINTVHGYILCICILCRFSEAQ